MIDPRHLRTLREIAERGTVTAAAEALGYSPSALSQQVSALEREIGVPVLVRAGREVRLTRVGTTLVRHADRILAAIEDAAAAVEEHRGDLSGELRLGAFPTVARHLVAPTLAAVQQAHPELVVSLEILEPEESLPMLVSGGLDIALTHEYSFLPTDNGAGVYREEIHVEPMLLALPRGTAQPNGPVELTSLRNQMWVAGRPDSTCGRMVRRACEAAGFIPNVRYVSDDFAVALGLVEEGVAVALIPRLGLEPDFGVEVREPAGLEMIRRLYAATRRGAQRRPAIAAILGELKARGSTKSEAPA